MLEDNQGSRGSALVEKSCGCGRMTTTAFEPDPLNTSTSADLELASLNFSDYPETGSVRADMNYPQSLNATDAMNRKDRDHLDTQTVPSGASEKPDMWYWRVGLFAGGGAGICCAGVVCNIIAIIVLLNFRKKSSAPFLLVCLACLESLFLLSYLFLENIALLSWGGLITSGYVDNMKRTYSVLYPLPHIFHTCLAYLEVVITLERCVVVAWPLRARDLCSLKSARIALACVMVYSVVYHIPTYAAFTYRQVWQNGSGTWEHDFIRTEFGNSLFYNTIFIKWMHLIFNFGVPSLLLLVFNTLLVLALRRSAFSGSTVDESRAAREKRLTVMVSFMTTIFLVVQLMEGIALAMLAGLSEYEEAPIAVNRFSAVADTLMLLNSATNFAIYCATGRLFRETFLRLFCSSCSWRTRCRGNTRGSAPENRKEREHRKTATAPNTQMTQVSTARNSTQPQAAPYATVTQVSSPINSTRPETEAAANTQVIQVSTRPEAPPNSQMTQVSTQMNSKRPEAAPNTQVTQVSTQINSTRSETEAAPNTQVTQLSSPMNSTRPEAAPNTQVIQVSTQMNSTRPEAAPNSQVTQVSTAMNSSRPETEAAANTQVTQVSTQMNSTRLETEAAPNTQVTQLSSPMNSTRPEAAPNTQVTQVSTQMNSTGPEAAPNTQVTQVSTQMNSTQPETEAAPHTQVTQVSTQINSTRPKTEAAPNTQVTQLSSPMNSTRAEAAPNTQETQVSTQMNSTGPEAAPNTQVTQVSTQVNSKRPETEAALNTQVTQVSTQMNSTGPEAAPNTQVTQVSNQINSKRPEAAPNTRVTQVSTHMNSTRPETEAAPNTQVTQVSTAMSSTRPEAASTRHRSVEGLNKTSQSISP
ncbi:hypothetical protein RRG08_047973 [Elysia crispata]|uniref:G-protein coupled receptors family 1 profile domain-containing protein n=1 Tax=Elysia crispata TaxID=231223 RepID=A0AAE1DMY0_9GAST|nr:hypothetical protein RRG08_047973 [Elysia crispata]